MAWRATDLDLSLLSDESLDVHPHSHKENEREWAAFARGPAGGWSGEREPLGDWDDILNYRVSAQTALR